MTPEERQILVLEAENAELRKALKKAHADRSCVAEIRQRLAPFPEYVTEFFYALIVPDHAAGKRHRYTVYRIPAAPSRRVKIVGRELPLSDARTVAKKALQR